MVRGSYLRAGRCPRAGGRTFLKRAPPAGHLFESCSSDVTWRNAAKFD
jgi:hypothetical protein